MTRDHFERVKALSLSLPEKIDGIGFDNLSAASRDEWIRLLSDLKDKPEFKRLILSRLRQFHRTLEDRFTQENDDVDAMQDAASLLLSAIRQILAELFPGTLQLANCPLRVQFHGDNRMFLHPRPDEPIQREVVLV
jgi:hypothetical protein